MGQTAHGPAGEDDAGSPSLRRETGSNIQGFYVPERCVRDPEESEQRIGTKCPGCVGFKKYTDVFQMTKTGSGLSALK